MPMLGSQVYKSRMFGVNDAMDQPTFADLEYDGKKRKTRREIFLERMDSLIPWDQLEDRIRPSYPKPESTDAMRPWRWNKG